VRFADWRAGDQRYFVADTRLIRSTLGLAEAQGWQEGVTDLAGWISKERGLRDAPMPLKVRA
jgi:CDP-paratose 2-epimerase